MSPRPRGSPVEVLRQCRYGLVGQRPVVLPHVRGELAGARSTIELIARREREVLDEEGGVA